MMYETMWAGHWLWMLVFAVVVVFPVWRICARAGYPGWLALLVLFPILNLALLYFLAFAEWPALKKDSRQPAPEEKE